MTPHCSEMLVVAKSLFVIAKIVLVIAKFIRHVRSHALSVLNPENVHGWKFSLFSRLPSIRENLPHAEVVFN